MFISTESEASLIRDVTQFEEHWVPDLDRCVMRGAETPGLVLIKAHGKRVQYWDGEENGTILL